MKRITQLLDHPLELNSQPGRGTVFLLTVPLAPVVASPAPVAVPARDAAAEGLCGRKVLIVDNERDILDAMQLMFETWGCRVSVALSRDEALDVVRRVGAPDVIVSDLRLTGGYNGFDVIGAVREAVGAAVPGAIISGDTAPAQLRQAAAAGLPLLHKPVAPGLLRASLIRLCASPAALGPLEQ